MSALQGMSRADEELLDQKKAEFMEKDQWEEQHIDQMDRAIAVNEHVFEQNQATLEQELALSNWICDIKESFQQAVLELKR